MQFDKETRERLGEVEIQQFRNGETVKVYR